MKQLPTTTLVLSEQEVGLIFTDEVGRLLEAETKRQRKVHFSWLSKVLPALTRERRWKLLYITIGADATGEACILATFQEQIQ